ncbi:peptidase inhibitor family I36 protein [Actinosynnema pretiosum subsp. pretiosum]|nr:hypothetical protein APASM_1265 [Actinosynnema pretiosum subsp. pretiosum]QUF07041.1 peptidase inhibitor family I36 protein [Actinosynnema pretiosum subsp. pretiosum]
MKITAAALTAVAGAALATAPAQADPAAWPCVEFGFCMYAGAAGEGRRIEMLEGVSDLGAINGGLLNDNVRSVKNISGDSWCLYDSPDYENEIAVILDGMAEAVDWEKIGSKVTSAEAC